MNERAIKKLRRKFTLTALISFVLVMALMCSTIYLVNFFSAKKLIQKSLDFISDNHDVFYFADYNDTETSDKVNKLSRKKSDNFFLEFLEDIFNTGVDSSSEFIYSLRFFTVSFDSGGNAKKISTNHIALIDEEIKLMR